MSERGGQEQPSARATASATSTTEPAGRASAMIPLIPSSADESLEEVVSFRELKGKGTAVVAVDDPVKKLDAVKSPKAIAVPTNLPQGNDARHEFFDRMFRAVENLTPVDDVRVATFMAS